MKYDYFFEVFFWLIIPILLRYYLIGFYRSTERSKRSAISFETLF